MATRAGSVDPGLLLWVQRHGGIEPAAAERALDREAGLRALSGRSGDMREVLAEADGGDERCRLALNVYVHRLAAGVAAMAASMNGLDAVVFTGGVGENASTVRAETVKRLAFLGLAIEPSVNATTEAKDRVVSPPGSQAKVVVVAAGMEGALPSVVGGLVEAPVIAVPTSVGYGASFQGIAALLAMLNSCASGIAVVNIDNGFGAGYMACVILRSGVEATAD
jgi:acetate kinase